MIAFAVIGLVFSSRQFILTLNRLNPVQGLLVYYTYLFLALEFLRWLGLVIGGVKMTSITQTLGELMIVFAFFIIVDFESEWVAHVVGESEGKKKDYPVVYTQSEDGSVYYLWKTFVTDNPDLLRIFTFVLTPAVLVGFGLYLTGNGKIRRELIY